MRLVMTGTPCVGKTTLAHHLARQLHLKVVSESQFCQKHGIGKWDANTREREVPLDKLAKSLSKWLESHDNVIIEGHLSCEMPLRPVDAVIVVRLSPERLAYRLSKRKTYSQVKIQDNVLCEGISYCKHHAIMHYKNRVLEIENDKALKETVAIIIRKLKEKGLCK